MVPFFEPGLDEMLQRNLAAGRLRFTTSYQETADFGDIHFICVGTPQRAGGMGADLSHVESAVTGLAAHLRRKALIVGKSTVPVGTAEWVERLVDKHADAALGVEVAWSPEFLQEGFAVQDVLRPSRVVVGVRSDWAERHAVRRARRHLRPGRHRGPRGARRGDRLRHRRAGQGGGERVPGHQDLVHQRDGGGLRGRRGGDVTQLSRAIGYDPRIGSRFLHAGVGFGGGCLPRTSGPSRPGLRSWARARRCASCTRSI
nr:hypothetical protein GCM10020092_028940 [Actinoplanes digitatis]